MTFKQQFQLIFHGSVAITYFAAIVRFELLPPMPHKKEHELFAGRFKYLTYWNLIVQFLFFALSTYMDTKKSRNNAKWIRMRDKLFSGVVMPYGLFVFGVFWILYAINRELIFPKILDTMFPAWLNHVVHTVILPVLLIETKLLKHRQPRRKDGLSLTLLFGAIYIIWVLYLALVMDIWPYPILQMMNWGMRFVFFGVCIGFLVITYLISEKINCFAWGI